MNNPSIYLRRKHAAEYLRARYGVGSACTLAKLASIGGGPIYIKLGGVVVYDPADLDAWARSRMTRHRASSVLAAAICT